MDWTGGTRRRYARGKENVVLQKQKAHFSKMAKASAEPPPPLHSTPSFMKEPRLHHTNGQARMESLHRRKLDSQNGIRRRSQSTQRRRCRGSSTRSRMSGSSTSSRRQDISPGERDKHGNSDRYARKPQSLTPTHEINEADSLRAQKRKLLARSDWLGLAAARPLRLKFKQDRDNDRIGKRRKVQRQPGTHNLQNQHERVPTPPFQGQHFEALMSGALPSEDIQIKVGTDALATQTQFSRQFQTPVATSVRPISVESEPLSEESMLLGVDEDGFEAGSAQPLLRKFSQPSARVSNHRDDCDTSSTVNRWPFQLDQDETLTLQSWTAPVANERDPDTASNAIDMGHHAFTYEWQQRDHVHPWSEKCPENAQMYIPSNTRTVEDHNTDSRSDTPMTTRSHDEGRWQRVLNVRPVIATQASVVVLRSSSAHDSESDLGVWPLQNFAVPQDEQGNDMSPVDDGAQTQIPEHLQPDQLQEANVNKTDPAPIEVSSPMVDTNDQLHNDESLWREFIIESQDSESVAADGIGKSLGVYQNDSGPLSPAPRSTPPMKSYGTRSDRVTIGDSCLTDQGSAVLLDGNSWNDFTNTSLAGHATTHMPEEDSSDGLKKVSHEGKGCNIHMPRTSTRAHQRFKGQRRKTTNDCDVPESTRLFKTILPTSTRATAHSKSIYSVPSSG